MRSFDDFLRRMPKAELHCHLVGALPAETAWAIARRNAVSLPADDAGSLYRFTDFHQFIERYLAVARTLRTSKDFAEAAYVALRDGYIHGNVLYREMFFNPTDHYRDGVSYRVMLDGLLEGLRAAQQDFGVRGRLIPSINRMEEPAVAVHMVEDVVRWRRDEVIGIGLDASEPDGPPGRFAEAFDLAGKAGLKRTAHVCEDYAGLAGGPPRNAIVCLERLGCDRLDHGYNIVADPDVMTRCRDAGVAFTCCLPGSNPRLRAGRVRSIRTMLDLGLRVSLHSDDPAMHGANPGEVYAYAGTALRLDADEAVALCMTALDSAWLDDDERVELRRSFLADISRLRGELPESGHASAGSA